MHKRFTFEELCSVNTNFYKNLKKLYTSKRYSFFKEFVKNCFLEWDDVYYFEWWEVIFRLHKKEWWILLVDEKDKIELSIDQDWVNKLHNLLKNDKNISKIKESTDTILNELNNAYTWWEMRSINSKPFIVYDIETIWDINNLKDMKFIMAYSSNSLDNNSKNIQYKYVSDKSLKKFVDYLFNFDWYVVWYNNIYFDNPVICYNLWYWDWIIDEINRKSIDLYQFILNITWKRISLDKAASSLVSVWKTLSSWLEWSEFYKEYLKTWEESLLNKVKNYCKNDVKMTLMLLLYLVNYKRLYIDWKEFAYDEIDLVKYWLSKKLKKSQNPPSISIFW